MSGKAGAPRLSPGKLLMSKWTAAVPRDREKHFIVVRLVAPDPAEAPPVEVELQAVYSGRSQVLPWRELRDATRWLQGWR